MSASNPVPTSNAAGYEPSMEEILASIRRIIADDQSIPKAMAAEALAPPQEPEVATTPVPVSRLRVEPSPPPMSPPPPSFVRTPSFAPMLEHAETSTEPSIAPDPPVLPEAFVRPDPVVAREPAAETRAARGTIAAPQFPMPDAPHPAQAPTPPHAATSTAPEDDRPAHAPTSAEARTASPAPSRMPFDASALLSADTNKSVAAAFNALAVSRLTDNSDELMAIAREMIRPLLRSWIDDNLPTMVERMVRDEIERAARGAP